MGKLGDFLEAVYSPSNGFATVQASIRKWRNRDLAETATGGERSVWGRSKPRSSKSQINVTNLKVWIAPDDCARVEKERQVGERLESSLTIVRGDQWWARDHEGHVEVPGNVRSRGPAMTDAERHFSHAQLREFFCGLDLREEGLIRTAGFDCARVRATLRTGGQIWPHWLPPGADEYEFHVEPARGVILSIQARCAGEAFETYEVADVVFDQPLADELFTYSPAYAEQVRPCVPATEFISLVAAIERMPFTVLVPSQLPDVEHVQLDVIHHPARLRSPRETLCLGYRWHEPRLSVSVYEAATADPELDNFEWELVRHRDRDLRITDPGAGLGHRGIAMEHAGTHILLWSEIDRQTLLDVAASFAPAVARPG